MPDPFGNIATDVITAISTWVSGGATWLITQLISLMTTSSSISLGVPWYEQHYALMVAMSAFVMLPILIFAAFQGAITGNAGGVAFTAFLYVPLVLFGMAVAIPVVDWLLGVVDWLDAGVMTTLKPDFATFSANITHAMGATGSSAAAPFIVFICALFMAFFGLLVFVEMMFRDAAVYSMAIFIPIAFSVMILPATAKVSRKLLDGLIGLIFYKFLIVAVFSIGVAAVANGAGSGSFATVLSGLVILILCAVLPNLLIGYLPVLEGAAVAAIAGRRAIQSAAAQPALNSRDVYSQIRRTNESRLAASSAGAAGGSSRAVALLGSRQPSPGSGHVHVTGRPAGGGTPSAGPSGPGPGGVGPIGGGGGGGGAKGGRSGSGGVAGTPGAAGRPAAPRGGGGGAAAGAPGPQGPAGPRGPAGPPGQTATADPTATRAAALSARRPQATPPAGNGG